MDKVMQDLLAERLERYRPLSAPKPVAEDPATTALVEGRTATLQADRVSQGLIPEPQPKKITRKPREKWLPEYRLLSLGYPTPCERIGARKRYQIEIKYKDETGKRHKKNVLFGSPKISEYVDDGQELERVLRCVALKHTENCFHPNHWRLHLLNTRRTLSEAYTHYLAAVGLS